MGSKADAASPAASQPSPTTLARRKDGATHVNWELSIISTAAQRGRDVLRRRPIARANDRICISRLLDDLRVARRNDSHFRIRQFGGIPPAIFDSLQHCQSRETSEIRQFEKSDDTEQLVEEIAARAHASREA